MTSEDQQKDKEKELPPEKIVFEGMEEVEVNGMRYPVAFIYIDRGVEFIKPYYCAYVFLKAACLMNDEELGKPSFKKGDTVGVDTTHYHNEKMDLAEKKEDAKRQIQLHITCYLKNGFAEEVAHDEH